jgi:hypothetical protein
VLYDTVSSTQHTYTRATTSKKTQMKDDTNDFANNLAILKLYQSYTALTKEDVIVNVLIKALMGFEQSQTDFYMLRSVIHAAAFARSKKLSTLVELANLLEGVDFENFWKLVKETKDLDLNSVAGFKDRVRKYILNILQCAYRKMPKLKLEKALDTTTSEIDSMIKTGGWTQEGTLVVFPANEDNKNREKKYKESIHLDQLSEVIGILTRSTTTTKSSLAQKKRQTK